MIENYVGQWKGKEIQKPEEFQRERVVGEVKITLPEPPPIEESNISDLLKFLQGLTILARLRGLISK